MNRAAFGSWGADLDPPRFAAALASLGTFGTGADTIQRPLVRWRLPPEGLRALAHRDDAEVLADRWMAAIDAWRAAAPWPPEEQLPRLSVEVDPGVDPAWTVAQLSRPEIGPLSVHVMRPPFEGRLRWSWPLEIGLLEDPESARLRGLLSDADTFRPARFARTRAVSGAGGTCDLLLLTRPLRVVAGDVLASPLRASAVLVLRPPDGPWDVIGPLVRALQVDTGAAAFGFVPVPVARLEEWLHWVLNLLAHDLPLDVVVHLAARRVGGGPPLLLADAALLEETRISHVARRLAHRASRKPLHVAPPASVPPPARVPPPSRRAVDAAEQLAFDRESHGASELIAIGDELRSLAEAPEPPRFIQARVMQEQAPGARAPAKELLPGGDYVVAVRVAPPEAGWTSATGEAFPQIAAEGPQNLTVVLTAPGVLAEPEVQQIVLPGRGPSTTCEFPIRLAPDARALQARIIVLHGNRVLQTATLAAPVGPAGRGGLVLAAEPEATVRLRLDDLGLRRPFDATLVVNHDAGGAPGVTAIAGGRAQLLAPAEFQAAVDALRELLEDAVLEPAGYAGLEDPSSVKLLVALANHGQLLHATFMRSHGAQSVVDAERLQLVAVREGADFPLEFVYERAAPDPAAVLCPDAVQSLREGRCGAACPPPDDYSVVCPLAFWGLSKSIERHPHTGPVPSYELEVLAEPSGERSHLGTPGAALFATSARVAEPDVARLRADLGAVTGGHAREATSWQDWRDSVSGEHPPLLVIVAHTTPHPDLRLPAMEISDDTPLATTTIRKDIVCPSGEHRPVVILLGCNTAATEVPTHGFVPSFRANGAAIVLGTVTKVLGRHAAPVAARLVSELIARAESGETYFTDVVRDLRRALLSEGLPLGMALVAYGDGDWVLGGD